ncbi:Cysteine-rich receptor-like protein kinase 25 [Platanthera guangdongensis]|uniref:Cysteine-rich receptor-like protein kinase 25 n=1 Tax=Platanthera guangdongensis TaxID=2320717 RepID=A0ABR2MCL3_9ASPA
MTPTASSSSPSSLVIFLSIISLLATTAAAFKPLLIICSGDNHSIPSPFASNLRSSLANLIATTPNSPTHLFTNHYGTDSTADIVYGIAECRNDASPAMCADCLTEAADAGFNGTCAGRKSATIRYDYCLLRYADYLFYSSPSNFSFAYEFKPESAMSPAYFKSQVGKMLDKLVVATAVADSPLFAVAKTTYAQLSVPSKEMYGLAWCTLLGPEDCYSCLNQGLQGYHECCSVQIGGWVATASCVLAYDDQPFFNLSLLQIEAPPPDSGEGIVTETDPGSGKRNIFLIIATAILGTLTVLLFCVIVIQRRKRRTSNVGVDEDMGTAHESLRLPFAILKASTNSFSNENKLGEGRFGPVYKGVLDDGRQIMVNRLSKCSEKGLSEMRREVDLVAQLQHINLVKLFGYCVQNKEQLLVYEYLPMLLSTSTYLTQPCGKS